MIANTPMTLDELERLWRRSQQHHRVAEQVAQGQPVDTKLVPDLDPEWVAEVTGGWWDLEMLELSALLTETAFTQQTSLYAQYYEVPIRGVRDLVQNPD